MRLGTTYVEIKGDTKPLAKDLSRAHNQVAKAMKSIQRIAVVAFTGWGISQLGRDILRTNNAFTQFRMTLQTLEGSVSAANKKWAELLQFAQDTPFRIAQVMDSYKTMKAYGLDPTISAMRALGDTAAVMGGETLPRIAMALGQIQATGKVTAQDLNQLTQAGIEVNTVLKDAFGVGRGELDKLNAAIEAGVISMTDVYNSFLRYMRDHFGGQMERLNNTLKGQWEVLVSIWQQLEDTLMQSGLALYLTAILKSFNLWLEAIVKDQSALAKLGEVGAVGFGILLKGARLLEKSFMGLRLIWDTLRVAFWEFIKDYSAGIAKIGKENARFYRDLSQKALDAGWIDTSRALTGLSKAFLKMAEGIKNADDNLLQAQKDLKKHGEEIASNKSEIDDYIDIIKSQVDSLKSASDVVVENTSALADNKQMIKDVSDFSVKTAKKTENTWTHMYERLQDITADWIYNIKIDFDSIVNLFKRTVAQMISAWIWGQKNMQFMSSGQGNFSFGNMFGGGGTGTTASTSGWMRMAGAVKSGVMSAFSSIPIAGWIAAAAYVAAGIFSRSNISHGYGAISGGTKGYGKKTWQPGWAGTGDYAVDPAQQWFYGKMGWGPTMSSYFEYYRQQHQYWQALKALGPALMEWTDPIAAAILNKLGIFKALGIGNLKRSYLGREYTYSQYSLESGWGAPEMIEYKEKRKGEDFRKSADAMAQSGLDLMNMLDRIFKDLLDSFGGDWITKFTDKMKQFAGLSFKFYISAEDKKEFEEDWKTSWKHMTEGIIDPIVEVGTDLLEQALKGTVADSSVWNYFTEDFCKYLKDSLHRSLEDLRIDWSSITKQEDLEKVLEQLGLASENIKMIVSHFEVVGEIMSEVSDTIGMSGLSGSAQEAVHSFRGINEQFDEYAFTLESMGIDLEKYTDLEKARLLVLENTGRALSDSAISGKDLAAALQDMTERMKETGKSAEEIADAMDAVRSGILGSIEDIRKRYEGYGKTALDLVYEKYPEWRGITIQDWLEFSGSLEDMTSEMLQEWRNFGDLLERQWEEQQKLLESAVNDKEEAVRENTNAVKEFIRELEKLIGAFHDAIDSITGYQEKLLTGAGVSGSALQQYAQAGRQLDKTVQSLYSAKDRNEALAAVQLIPDYVAQFLKTAEAAAATPEQYRQSFARAMAILNTTASIGRKWEKASSRLLELVRYWAGRDPVTALAVTRPYDLRVRRIFSSMQSGGKVSGPETGYQAPITFHGTEHIVPGDQMSEVKQELTDIKKVLVCIMNTGGDQNKMNKKLYRIFDKVSQGNDYLMTKAV